MERQFETVISDKGGIEVSKEITDVFGTELKSTNMNDVWLLITSASDSRVTGDPLAFEGATYYLPEIQMAALVISPGDTVRLVFSDVLETAILQKWSAD